MFPRASEQIMQLNEATGATSESSSETSLKSIPAFFAGVFLFYIFTSFFLMASTEFGTDDTGIESFFLRIHVANLHTYFFKYSIVGGIVVPIILFTEWLCVGRDRSSLYSMFRNRSWSGRSDLICFVLTHLRLLRIPQIIFTFGFALISGSMISSFVTRHLFPGFVGFSPPAYLAYPLYFLLYTLFDYLAHRVDHSRYFWPLHRFHHAAEEFNVFTADRGHPASAFTQSGLKIFPLALLGVPPDAVIDIGILIAVINYLNHSRIDWDFGWFGRYVIQSPLHHQLHHSRALRRPCNLSICPIWDRLGGTWRDVTTSSIKLGTSVSYRHGAFIVPDLLRDYRDFLRGLWRGAKELRKTVTRTKKPQQVQSAAPRPSSDGVPLQAAQTDGSAEANGTLLASD
jgi:sterol desaturase/sphingolipid hydroxylase (fatty acid hydroxylase superfamily)